jgi:hypothetical protein
MVLIFFLLTFEDKAMLAGKAPSINDSDASTATLGSNAVPQ